jgi:hypothetical protein
VHEKIESCPLNNKVMTEDLKYKGRQPVAVGYLDPVNIK